MEKPENRAIGEPKASSSQLWRLGKWMFLAHVAVAAWLVFSSDFGVDEWEHLHASWHVAEGRIPYRDFFEHHFFLLYYLLAPLVSVWPESLTIMYPARVVNLSLTIGSAALLVGIGRSLCGSAVGYWSAALWLSTTAVLEFAFQVRPDTPMTALLVLATWLCVDAGGRSRVGSARPSAAEGLPWRWIAAGAAWGTAFWFSPKAVSFVPALVLLALVGGSAGRRTRGTSGDGVQRGEIKTLLSGRTIVRHLGGLACGSGAVILAGFGHLLAMGVLEAWWDWTIRFNLTLVHSVVDHPGELLRAYLVHPSPVRRMLLKNNSLAALLVGAGALAAVTGKLGDLRCRIILLGGAVTTGMVVAGVFRKFPWDVMPTLVFPSFLAGWAAVASLEWLRQRGGRFSSWLVGAFVVVLFGQHFAWLATPVIPRNQLQFERFQYVHDNTEPDDLIYQSWPLFSLYRPDADYLWLFRRPRRRAALAAGLPGGPDFRKLVESRRPAYLSDGGESRRHHRWLLDVAGYRWLPRYQIYERADLP